MIRKHYELSVRCAQTKELRAITVKVQASEEVQGLHVCIDTGADTLEHQRELECPQILEPSLN